MSIRTIVVRCVFHRQASYVHLNISDYQRHHIVEVPFWVAFHERGKGCEWLCLGRVHALAEAPHSSFTAVGPNNPNQEQNLPRKNLSGAAQKEDVPAPIRPVSTINQNACCLRTQ